MNKGELIVALAEKSSVTKKDTAAVLDAFVEVVKPHGGKGPQYCCGSQEG